jgi:hypothetical protein
LSLTKKAGGWVANFRPGGENLIITSILKVFLKGLIGRLE